MISSVKWKGLTKTIYDLRRDLPKRMERSCNGMTKDVLNVVHTVYVENLSGARPSTAAQPLPVGMRSGDLRAGAKKRQINQYAGEIVDDVDYSGWIEIGTWKMAPRRPLGNAVDLAGEMVPGEMGQVLTEIVL